MRTTVPGNSPRRPHALASALALAVLAGSLSPALAQPTTLQPTPPPRPAEPPPPPPRQPDAPATAAPVPMGPTYDISSFIFRYATSNPDQPALEGLMDLEVTFGDRDGVLAAPEPGLPTVTLTLRDLTSAQRARRAYSASAINTIAAAVVRALNDREVIGVLVTPEPSQIDPQTLEDLRPQELRTLTLNIWTRTVSAVRTMGSGDRWDRPIARGERPSQETRINHRVHRRIRELSPLQPGEAGVSGDVLQRDALDNYLYRLNRHPGRRVDAAISAGETPGEVVLDYIVTENKPWLLYFQLSNTGTEETNEWRERLGFVHYQLTSRDDIFSIDYITAGFDDTNAVLASYEAAFGTSQTLRYRAYGNWSQFTASDVGFEDENFEGDSWSVGGELIANVWQRGQAFVDVFGGVRYEDIEVSNFTGLEGEGQFLIPYLGVRFERERTLNSTHAELRLETVASGDSDDVDALGRTEADDEWTALKWRVSHSLYLDPHLRKADRTVLAHELAFSGSGQHAFGNRLIPQEQEVVGGLYTVRGYEEAEAAGDNVYMASVEYRFHWPRTLAPREPGRFGNRTFRWAPAEEYGRPDWDLVLKAFLDVGRADNNDALAFEDDETLIGAGVGFELQVLRNFNLRTDLAFPLKDVGDTDAGEPRLHFVATLLY